MFVVYFQLGKKGQNHDRNQNMLTQAQLGNLELR